MRRKSERGYFEERSGPTIRIGRGKKKWREKGEKRQQNINFVVARKGNTTGREPERRKAQTRERGRETTRKRDNLKKKDIEIRAF